MTNFYKKTKMKIACLGWGSLIWEPKRLKVQKEWHKDGPLLPIEFNRISKGKRVTLIIDEESKPLKVLWALMTKNNLNEAIESLWEREDCFKKEDIHFLKFSDDPGDKIESVIVDWLKSKGLDAAVWTGLSYKNREGKNKRMSIEEVIEHLKNLGCNEQKAAEEYIRKAPRQIKTEYRKRIEAKFNWMPA